MGQLKSAPVSAAELTASGATISSLNAELPLASLQVTERVQPRFLDSYRFSVSSWPVFIDAETIAREVEPLVSTMPRLLYRALFTRFRQDPDGLEQYFGWSRHLLGELMKMRVDPNELVARYDVFMGANGTQLLEINCGSNIGGWELDWMAPAMSESLAANGIGKPNELQYRKIFQKLLNHMYELLTRRASTDVEGNLLIQVASRYEGPARTSFIESLEEVDRVIRPTQFANGRVMFFERLDELVFDPSGVSYHGKRIDTILVWCPGENVGKFYSDLTTASVSGKIVTVDSHFHRLLGDKRLLALLHECARDGLLSDKEAAFVQRYVPWSYRVVDETASWNGQTAQLPTLLRRHQAAFVLKRANSFGGKNVIVGKLCEDERWSSAVQRALDDGDWVAQAYTPPGRQLAHAPNEGFVAHDLVWGFFAFGGNYCGAFVRGSRSELRNGVINSANGALEFLVMEQTAPAEDAAVATIEDALSPLNSKLLQALERDPELRAERIDLNGPRMPEFMRGWRMKLSPWPLIVDKHFVEHQFSTLLNEVPRVLYQTIQAYFERDSQAFQKLFDLPANVYELLRRRPPDLRNFNARYDLCVNAGSAQILEINIGSASGGIHVDWFQPFSDEIMGRHSLTKNWNLQRQEIFRTLLESLINAMLRKSGHVSGNILFYSFVSAPEAQRDMQSAFQRVYDSIKPAELAEGRIHLFTDFSDISFDAAGQVRFAEATMDAVLFTFAVHVDVPSGLYLRLSDASLRGRVVFPDALAYSLLGNKNVFALAYECVERGLLDKHDSAIVRQSLPWTAMLRQRDVEWRGERTALTTLLTSNRARFVLKKAVSYGGRDVVVGRYCTDEQWKTHVAQYMGDHGWLAQEYCPPGVIRMYDPETGIAPHDLIWGLFSFGGRYGGTYLRAQPLAGTDGVINAAKGAVEVIMYQQSD